MVVHDPTTATERALTLIDQLTVDCFKLLLEERAKNFRRMYEDYGTSYQQQLNDLARLARDAAKALVIEMER